MDFGREGRWCGKGRHLVGGVDTESDEDDGDDGDDGDDDRG